MQIKYKSDVCKSCGKRRLIVIKSKKLCYYCNEKRKIQKTKERLLKKGITKKYEELNIFYKKVWDSTNPKICYETGVKILRYKKWHIHHVLEKSKYPEHIFNPSVCVLLTLQQHSLWHTLNNEQRQKQMPKTYNKFIELKKQYGYE